MILTDKCKQDFLKWLQVTRNEDINDDGIKYDLYYLFVYMMPEICKNALIIEWFDSIGIYIQISFDDLHTEEKIHIVFDAHVNKSWVVTNCSSRKEATDKAIEMSNDIYNDNYSKEKSEEFINNQKTK